ncbi:MAG: homocysteine S-methyltransferase family protein, partial [Anaeromassilibacillus sp.]
CGEKAGADLILIETMSDTYEAKAALLAAKENTSLPVFVTMIFDEKGKLLTGGDIAAAVALLEGLGADAIGFNCGLGPEQMRTLFPQLLDCCSIPMIVNPNAGLPRSVDGRTVFDVGPEEFAAVMEELVREGAWLAGGCCGTTPAHIAAMIQRCKRSSPPPCNRKNAR